MPLKAHAQLFHTTEVKTDRVASIPKWVALLGRQNAELPTLEDCQRNIEQCPTSPHRRWHDMMADAAGQSEEDQIRMVHRFINEFPYITDDVIWGRSDYWETLREFLEKSGDCEDFAIAKYISLRLLGFPEERLRLLVVKDTVREIPHAILGVKSGGEEYILDNLSTSPLPQRLVFQYRPYYGVNAHNRWIFINAAKE